MMRPDLILYVIVGLAILICVLVPETEDKEWEGECEVIPFPKLEGAMSGVVPLRLVGDECDCPSCTGPEAA